MRIARVQLDAPSWAAFDGAEWRPISDPFEAFAAGRDADVLGDVIDEPVFLAPCEPRTVVGIAQNGPDAPMPVQAWFKSPRTIVATGTEVVLRRDAGMQIAEAEIAIVIGCDAFQVDVVAAASVVLGVTAVNDLTSPDRVEHDPRGFESKGGLGYTPLGPWIDTDADLSNLPYQLVVDGEIAAETNASALPASVAACVSYVSHWIPLGPGDIIMTGAPFSNAPISPGQTVEVRVGAMTLETPTR